MLTSCLLSFNMLTWCLLPFNMLTWCLLFFNMLTWCLLFFNMLTWCLLSFTMLTWCLLPFNMLIWCLLSFNMLNWCLLSFNMLTWCLLPFNMLTWCLLPFNMLIWCLLSFTMLIWCVNNRELFDTEKTSNDWQNYVDYLDAMVVDGFVQVVACSLKYLLENASADKTSGPLFEILLELHAPKMTFIPDVEPGAQGGFWDLIESLISDIYTQASLIPRLKSGDLQPYETCIESNPELTDIKENVLDAVDKTIQEVTQYRDGLNSYSSLWVEDRQEYMNLFLKYNHKPTPEELSMAGDEGIPENPPTLAQFKDMIEYYEKLYLEIEQMQAVLVFSKWLRVDARSFKQGLLNVVKRWSHMFKQHLIDKVTG
uniref:Dynein heavy chain tail domain-containing protein n=1 Tax=Biomphalaria glabrata TaxID=6526 RepID=A0A2C9LHC0_BIOGL